LRRGAPADRGTLPPALAAGAQFRGSHVPLAARQRRRARRVAASPPPVDTPLPVQRLALTSIGQPLAQPGGLVALVSGAVPVGREVLAFGAATLPAIQTDRHSGSES
jgi:hypothetical protein